MEKKTIAKKKSLLRDFGISKRLIDELFEGKTFRSLRELDNFADNIIGKHLTIVDSQQA